MTRRQVSVVIAIGGLLLFLYALASLVACLDLIATVSSTPGRCLDEALLAVVGAVVSVLAGRRG